MVAPTNVLSLDGILRNEVFRWYFPETEFFECYRTNFPNKVRLTPDRLTPDNISIYAVAG